MKNTKPKGSLAVGYGSLVGNRQFDRMKVEVERITSFSRPRNLWYDLPRMASIAVGRLC